MLLLLNKSVARKSVSGLDKMAEIFPLSEAESISLCILEQATKSQIRLFIAPESLHILLSLEQTYALHSIRPFLDHVDVLYPGRYFKRWARRLRQRGFTREDTKVLSLATFGTNEAGKILGVSAVVTFDQSLTNKYTHEFAAIQDQFEAMIAGLEPPFCYARLPEVMLPQKALGLIQSFDLLETVCR
jgi:hypothetical protein